VKVSAAFQDITNLAFDTAPIIYYVEQSPRYFAVVDRIFHLVASGQLVAATSVITLAEVLVHPYRQGNQRLADEYKAFLLHSDDFRTMSIDDAAADQAARLRAKYQLLTPDAIQLAMAVNAGFQVFLTNDRGLQRVTEIRVLILDDLEL
jgi:predicted nucleic acid-binding protein